MSTNLIKTNPWNRIKTGQYDAISPEELDILSDSQIKKFIIMSGYYTKDEVVDASMEVNRKRAVDIIDDAQSEDEPLEDESDRDSGSDSSDSDGENRSRSLSDSGDDGQQKTFSDPREAYKHIHGYYPDEKREEESARIQALRSLRRAESRSRSRSRSGGGSTSERRKIIQKEDDRYKEYGNLSELMAKIRSRHN